MNNYDKLIQLRDNLIKGKTTVEDLNNLEAIIDMMELCPVVFFISDNMCLALQQYFLQRAGYISHEFDPDVHRFTRELDDYIKNKILKEV